MPIGEGQAEAGIERQLFTYVAFNLLLLASLAQARPDCQPVA